MGIFSSLDNIVQGVYDMRKGGGQRKGAEQSIENDVNLAYDRGKMTDQESSQYSNSFDIGKLVEQLYKYQMGMGQAPEGYASPQDQYFNQTGELGRGIYDTVMSDLKDPYRTYESNLQPQLKAAEDYINTQMQKRGLLNSGLNIENMGRAGIDLAIAEADKRMQYRADAIQRAGAVSDILQSTQSGNLANLANLYSTQQQYGQNAMNRQSGQALGVLDTQVAPQFARLGEAYGNILGGRESIRKGMQEGAQIGDKFLDFYTGGATSSGSKPTLGMSFMGGK